MIDPQDLLYTNNFIETDILSNQQIERQTKNYDRFIDYQSELNNSQTNNTIRFLDNDDQETDEINMKKTLYEPFPLHNKKNNYPLMDPLLRDLSKDRYTKLKETRISIDTGYRNIRLYPLTSNFMINLGRDLSNIHKIAIENLVIPNFTKSVSDIQNNFCWQYLSDYYLFTDLSYNIVPFPNPQKIYSYFQLPYSSYEIPDDIFQKDPNYDPSDFLTNQFNISPGNYSLSLLLKEISLRSQQILHGNQLNLRTNVNQVVEEPYHSFPNLLDTPMTWLNEFDTVNNRLFFTNKMENIEILSIQFFKNSLTNTSPLTPNYFKENDIYYGYSSLGASYTLDPEYIYITVPFIQGLTDQWFDNSINKDNKDLYPDNNYENPFIPSAFPLVINNINIDQPLNSEVIKEFTMTPFFNLDVYTTKKYFLQSDPYTEDELFNVNYYKYSDIIQIKDGDLNIKCVRLAFRFNPNNSKEKPFSNKFPRPKTEYYRPASDNTILCSSILVNYFSNKTNVFYISYVNLLLLGRSLVTRFIYGQQDNVFTNAKNESIYESKLSLLEYFDFSIANSTNALLYSLTNVGFSFIHSNFYGPVYNESNALEEALTLLIANNFKTIGINYYFDSNNYFITNNNFVFLRFIFNQLDHQANRQDNLIISYNENEFHVNQNYSIDDRVKDLKIGETIECLRSTDQFVKDYNGVFCKILVSSLAGNISTVSNNISSKVIFNAYEKLLDNVTFLTIQLLDSNLRIIKTVGDYNFDLVFTTSVEKLKETNINTKTNKVDLVGINY